jgi:hypothetical protein
VRGVEEGREAKAVEEAGRLAERIAEIIKELEGADARVMAALAAVSAIVEKSQLTLFEQAALLKLLELFFNWSAKEVYDRYQPPPGIM